MRAARLTSGGLCVAADTFNFAVLSHFVGWPEPVREAALAARRVGLPLFQATLRSGVSASLKKGFLLVSSYNASAAPRTLALAAAARATRLGAD